MNHYSIEVKNVHHSFGSHVVLAGLDLTVRSGEIFALLGPNGSGKTTIINMLTTLIDPDRGEIFVAGCSARTDRQEVRRRISLTGQSAAVDDALTGTENLRMFARLSGLTGGEARRRADELSAQFDLTAAASRAVRTYSGGMRRRLDLALSLVVTPEVLFLDEPTTGLDTRSRRELWGIIRSLAASGTTVFLTTQYLEEADQLADRIAVLHGGTVAALGTPEELKARIGNDTVEAFDRSGNLMHAIPTDGSVAGLRRALDELDQNESGSHGSITVRRPSLDDVFLRLTSNDLAPSKELS